MNMKLKLVLSRLQIILPIKVELILIQRFSILYRNEVFSPMY